MSELRFIGQPELEEAPRFFEFKKRHFTQPFPGMVDLGYDPYPEANEDDTVRNEIISRELIFHAQLQGPADSLDLDTAVEFDGNRFALTEVREQPEPQAGESRFDVTGVARIAGEEPREALIRLRAAMAASKN